MTVIHGDVYCKPREGETQTSGGLEKKNVKWRKDPACRMILLNFVRKIVIVCVYDRRQFTHLRVSLQWSFSLSALYDITRGMLLLCELTMLSDMIGSRSALVQTAQHTLRTHKHTLRCMCTLSLLIPSHYCRQYLQCLGTGTCNVAHRKHTIHLLCMWQSRKLSRKARDSREIKRFPFSSIMDSLRFTYVYLCESLQTLWSVTVAETQPFSLNWLYSGTPLCAALYTQAQLVYNMILAGFRRLSAAVLDLLQLCGKVDCEWDKLLLPSPYERARVCARVCVFMCVSWWMNLQSGKQGHSPLCSLSVPWKPDRRAMVAHRSQMRR